MNIYNNQYKILKTSTINNHVYSSISKSDFRFSIKPIKNKIVEHYNENSTSVSLTIN